MNNESLDLLTQRATAFVVEIGSQYRDMKRQMAEDKAINMYCNFNDQCYEVYSIWALKGGFIGISSKSLDETISAVFLPVEKVHFSINVSDATDEKPTDVKFIGFKG